MLYTLVCNHKELRNDLPSFVGVGPSIQIRTKMQLNVFYIILKVLEMSF